MGLIQTAAFLTMSAIGDEANIRAAIVALLRKTSQFVSIEELRLTLDDCESELRTERLDSVKFKRCLVSQLLRFNEACINSGLGPSTSKYLDQALYLLGYGDSPPSSELPAVSMLDIQVSCIQVYQVERFYFISTEEEKSWSPLNDLSRIIEGKPSEEILSDELRKNVFDILRRFLEIVTTHSTDFKHSVHAMNACICAHVNLSVLRQ